MIQSPVPHAQSISRSQTVWISSFCAVYCGGLVYVSCLCDSHLCSEYKLWSVKLFSRCGLCDRLTSSVHSFTSSGGKKPSQTNFPVSAAPTRGAAQRCVRGHTDTKSTLWCLGADTHKSAAVWWITRSCCSLWRGHETEELQSPIQSSALLHPVLILSAPAPAPAPDVVHRWGQT